MRPSFSGRRRAPLDAATLQAPNRLRVRHASHTTSTGSILFSAGAWLEGPRFRGTQILRGSLHSDSPKPLFESDNVADSAFGPCKTAKPAFCQNDLISLRRNLLVISNITNMGAVFPCLRYSL